MSYHAFLWQHYFRRLPSKALKTERYVFLTSHACLLAYSAMQYNFARQCTTQNRCYRSLAMKRWVIMYGIHIILKRIVKKAERNMTNLNWNHSKLSLLGNQRHDSNPGAILGTNGKCQQASQAQIIYSNRPFIKRVSDNNGAVSRSRTLTQWLAIHANLRLHWLLTSIVHIP